MGCDAGEPHLPVPVESVLGKQDVVLRGPGGESIPGLVAADLAGLGDGWYLEMPGNPLSPQCDDEPWADTADPAAMIEDHGIVGALRRSVTLTKGRRRRAVFLSAVLVCIGFSLPGFIGGILLPFAAIGLTVQFYDF